MSVYICYIDSKLSRKGIDRLLTAINKADSNIDREILEFEVINREDSNSKDIHKTSVLSWLRGG